MENVCSPFLSTPTPQVTPRPKVCTREIGAFWGCFVGFSEDGGTSRVSEGRTAPPRSLSFRLLLGALRQMTLVWKLFGGELSRGDPIPVWALAVVGVRACGVTVVAYFCFSYSCLGPRVKWNFITESLFERALRCGLLIWVHRITAVVGTTSTHTSWLIELSHAVAPG